MQQESRSHDPVTTTFQQLLLRFLRSTTTIVVELRALVILGVLAVVVALAALVANRRTM